MIFVLTFVGGLYALTICAVLPIVSIFAIRRLHCDANCSVELYLLCLEACGWTAAGVFYYYNTKSLRRLVHRYLGVVALYILTSVVLITQLLYLTGFLSDDNDPDVYVKVGAGGISLLTLLIVVLTFIVKKNKKPKVKRVETTVHHQTTFTLKNV
jgi:hypothetical protein